MNFGFKHIVLLVYVIVNFITFILFGVDKQKAIKDKRRISERTLLLWCVPGPFGGWAGMHKFRHKTKKVYFKVIIFAMCTLQLAAVVGLWYLIKHPF